MVIEKIVEPLRADKRVLFSWCLVLLLSSFAFYPALFYPIEKHSWDPHLHLRRAELFAKVFSEGSIYPRWVQDIYAGLGGPLFSFYPPLLYFALNILKALGLNYALAWRIIVALSICLAAFGSFGLGMELFNDAYVALACSVCYVYTPLLLHDLFQRGSPQGIALALFPSVLWSSLRFAKEPSGFRIALASLGWGALILFHNLSSLLLLPVLASFLVYAGVMHLRHRLSMFLISLSVIPLGYMVAASHVIPFSAEFRYVKVENIYGAKWAQPAAHFVLSPLELAGISILDAGLGNNSLEPVVGPVHFGILLFTPVTMVFLWKRKRLYDVGLMATLGAMMGLVIWLQAYQATPIWEKLTFLSILQFRWRLLSLTGPCTALMAGVLIKMCPPRARTLLVCIITIASIVSQLPSLYPSLLPVPKGIPVSSLDLRGLSALKEFLPKWRETEFTQEEALAASKDLVANLPQKAYIKCRERRNGYIKVCVNTPVAFEANFYTLYFPGWTGYLDGRKVPVKPAEKTGYISLRIPPGSHIVELRYEGTIAQHLGDSVSLATVLFLLLTGIFWKKQNEKRLESTHYLKPRWYLLFVLLVLIIVKASLIDSHTNLFRRASTCGSIYRAEAHTDVRFGGKIRLCGYTLPRKEFHPGDWIDITFYWEAEQPVDEMFSCFVHLLGKEFNPITGNPLWGQQDKWNPGGYPTNVWESGKLYRDRYRFRIFKETPPGDYHLEIGWYDPFTGKRLPPVIIKPTEGLSVSDIDSLLITGIRIRGK